MSAARLLAFAFSAAALVAGCDLVDGLPPVTGGGTGGPGGSTLFIEQGSLAGFQIHQPDERRNDPRAGDPSYIYLQAGKDAVSLPGPTIADAPGLFGLDRPAITESKAGFTVRFNARLSYVVSIQDFEEEISLPRVQLQRTAGTISSAFIFAGKGGPLGGGVAHQLQIHAVVDGVASAPTVPVTIEAR